MYMDFWFVLGFLDFVVVIICLEFVVISLDFGVVFFGFWCCLTNLGRISVV